MVDRHVENVVNPTVFCDSEDVTSNFRHRGPSSIPSGLGLLNTHKAISTVRALRRCFVKYEVATAQNNYDLGCYERELNWVWLLSNIVDYSHACPY
jgi:hypothetical protein